MSVMEGLGLWVAFERSIDAGPKAQDLARAIEVCREVGATWVALRAGAGSIKDQDLSQLSIETFDNAGFKVYLWPFCYKDALEGEMAILANWVKLRRPGVAGLPLGTVGAPRVAGVILNAEYEFMKSASAADASNLVHRTRMLGYDFVAHAPPDYPGSEGKGPLATLDRECDAILPQVYGFEHNDAGHVVHLKKVLAQYAARGLNMAKVWPILCTYRPLFRGFDANNKSIPTKPIPNEAETVAKDIIAGLEYMDSIGGCPAPSLYTIEALRTASRPGVGDAVLTALRARAWRRVVVPPAPAEPIPSTLPDQPVQELPPVVITADDTAPSGVSASQVQRIMQQVEEDAEEAVVTPWATPRARTGSSQKIAAVRIEEEGPDTEKP